MKKSSLLLIAVTFILAGCGAAGKLTDSAGSARFEDGIYSSTPSFISRTEKQAAQTETDALVEKTKASKIYLFGEKKDTVMIPENMSARIQYDKELGSTVVTVGENPYDWQNYIDPWGYYSPYTPYSIGSSWYWSRHYNPWYWDAWSYNPWYYRYGGWYGGWYDPWYYGYGGWYDPWYYGYGGWYGYMHPYYCGWYGGWDPYWHHHHHHGPIYIVGDKDDRWHGSRYSTGSDRVFTSRVSTRGGVGSSSSVGRTAASSSASRQSVSGKSVATRVSGTSANRTSASKVSAPRRISGTQAAASAGTGAVPARGTAVSRGSTSTVNRGTASAGQNFRRPTATVTAPSVNRGSGTPASASGSGYRPATSGSKSYGASGSSYRSSSSSSYRSSGSSSSSRSSSYNSGSSSRSSYSSGSSSSGRSSYGGGGGYSGGGSSRSGGSSGGRR